MASLSPSVRCYAVSLQGKCYDGTCQAESRTFEIKSITPPGTIPATNSEWFWGRLYTPGSVVGQIVPLAGESGRTVPTSPANVTEAVVTEAPEDPRAPGTQLTTALHMLNPTSSDRAEAQVWYRNNTPEHPPGVFNGMKVRPSELEDTSVQVVERCYTSFSGAGVQVQLQCCHVVNVVSFSTGGTWAW